MPKFQLTVLVSLFFIVDFWLGRSCRNSITAVALSSSSSNNDNKNRINIRMKITGGTATSQPPLAEVLLNLNQKLLNAIVQCDYETYDHLCADDISCMEPESNQHVVIGKAFHKYYFDVLGSGDNTKKDTKSITANVTMSQPHVQLLGGSNLRQPTVAVISYIKLTQTVDRDTNIPFTLQQTETRVWELREDQWKNVHFHKSPLSK
jgi:hypothetical protein